MTWCQRVDALGLWQLACPHHGDFMGFLPVAEALLLHHHRRVAVLLDGSVGGMAATPSAHFPIASWLPHIPGLWGAALHPVLW